MLSTIYQNCFPFTASWGQEQHLSFLACIQAWSTMPRKIIVILSVIVKGIELGFWKVKERTSHYSGWFCLQKKCFHSEILGQEILRWPWWSIPYSLDHLVQWLSNFFCKGQIINILGTEGQSSSGVLHCAVIV